MQSKTVFYIQPSTNGILGTVFVGLAKGASLDDPAVLHDDVHVVGVEHVNVSGDVTVDDQQVGALAGLDGTGLVLDVAHLGTVEGGAGDGLDRSEADLVDELVHLLDGAGAYGVTKEKESEPIVMTTPRFLASRRQS